MDDDFKRSGLRVNVHGRYFSGYLIHEVILLTKKTDLAASAGYQLDRLVSIWHEDGILASAMAGNEEKDIDLLEP